MRALAEEVGRGAMTEAARRAIDLARRASLAGQIGAATTVDEASVEAQLAQPPSTLVPIINATGVLVHTNLGRAPLAPEAIAAMASVSEGYSTLELDLERGERGDRHRHAAPLLVAATGAEDALVVNNAAAAMMLALASIARGREVIVSRGELVEIGGGFRIPDILAESGAKLIEVGTTNRTHLADYERAIGDQTALLLKVHRSSFAMIGFTAEVDLPGLAALGRARGLPVLYDAGSGYLGGIPGEPERPIREAFAAGVDAVVFSADKLLGGPQAGVLAGRRTLLDRARNHPLLRALRPDKATLAALVATLVLHRDEPTRIPLLALAGASTTDLTNRATAIAAALGPRASVVATEAKLGGGSSPMFTLPSVAVRLAGGSSDELARRLRLGRPAIGTRIADGAVLVDLRAVLPRQDESLQRALAVALAADEQAETA
jgi:L-seryl-tRNA(Ser) seleniumtransferase